MHLAVFPHADCYCQLKKPCLKNLKMVTEMGVFLFQRAGTLHIHDPAVLQRCVSLCDHVRCHQRQHIQQQPEVEAGSGQQAGAAGREPRALPAAGQQSEQLPHVCAWVCKRNETPLAISFTPGCPVACGLFNPFHNSS